jgi:hypothetical protein
MQKLFAYSLAILMAVTLIASTMGCGRGYIRTRRHSPGDRSVTIIKRPKYKGVAGRTKPVTTTKYNRAVK